MKISILAAIAIAISTVQSENTLGFSAGNDEFAATCFKKGEVIDGMNKICFYDCLGSTAAITVGAAQLCPITIRN